MTSVEDIETEFGSDLPLDIVDWHEVDDPSDLSDLVDGDYEEELREEFSSTEIYAIRDSMREVQDDPDPPDPPGVGDEQIAIVDELIQPTLIDRESGIEITPVYTETFRATTENDNRNHTTLCGQSYVEPVGEGEWHVTIEGQVIKDQLMQLHEMRPAEGEIKVIAEGFPDDVIVTFDRFTFEQTDDHNTAVFEHEGVTKRQPVFDFQLQTDESDN